MKAQTKELLSEFQRAYQMEEIMAGLLTDLVLLHHFPSGISKEDKLKIRRMLSVIRADTHKHQKIVSGMIKCLSKGSRGIKSRF